MNRPPKTRTLPVKYRGLIPDTCPSFHKSGSIRGMRARFYGSAAQLVRCGSCIYDISAAHNEDQILNACTCFNC